MSRYLDQTHCPKCPSSDAYTTYEDGSGYCFSCGYFKPPLGRSNQSMRKVLDKYSQIDSRAVSVEGKGTIMLPADASSYIPHEPLVWLKQYGLTNDEIRRNHICFSVQEQILIFPYFDRDGNCIFWQGRFFPKRSPKITSQGMAKNTIAIVPSERTSSTVVLVEDPVSAIKVARILPTLCLFGSHVPLSTAVYLQAQYEHCILWLDGDKAKEAVKFSQRYSYLFKEGIHVVRTEKDPKEYPTEKIKNFLTS